MATIYEFIVKNQVGEGTGTGGAGEGGAGKSARNIFGTSFSGKKGGVEANRKMRAINPMLNKMTGGWWEKGTRLGRAGVGLLKFNPKTGAFAGISGVAVAIIVSFIIQQVLRLQAKQQLEARKVNQNNFKKLEVGGEGAISEAYGVSTNFWDGKITYNKNK